MRATSRPLLLLLNGSFYTMDPARPRASAIAIDRGSGRIVAVGDAADMRAWSGRLTDTLDLGGRTVLPGFIDAHTHLLNYAHRRREVDLTGVRSEAEAAERVRAAAARIPTGQWVRGSHWDISLWTSATFPTRASLDAVAPDHPVALASYDLHSYWVNSEALRRAGITGATPDPMGGSIAHDAAGEPTGMLFEGGAMGLVESVIAPLDAPQLVHTPPLSADGQGERVIAPPDPDADLDLLRGVLADLRARGITGVHNIETPHSFRLMQRLRDRGELTPRVVFFLPKHSLPEIAQVGLQADFGDDALRFGGIKIFADGALTSRTAALFEPFEGQPDNHGLLTTSEAEMEALASAAAAGGVGVAIHAIGDRAVHAALDAIERGMPIHQRPGTGGASPPAPRPRFRLEHIQLATEADIARMARLGVVASVQPFHAVADRDKAERYWGARHRRAYAYRTLRDAGIPLALGSDVPVDTWDPLRILHAAVTRRNDQDPDRPAWVPEQALTLSEALYAYTLGAAYAAGQEQRQGSITPGKLADLVVLAEDPFTVPAGRLAGAEVAATLAGGALVYGALD